MKVLGQGSPGTTPGPPNSDTGSWNVMLWECQQLVRLSDGVQKIRTHQSVPGSSFTRIRLFAAATGLNSSALPHQSLIS